MVRLKDGTEPDDARLGRLVDFDVRSRSWPVSAVLPTRVPRSYTWRMGRALHQGDTSSCVSFMLGGQAVGRPAPLDRPERLSWSWLMARYCDMQAIDRWPGADRACGGAGPWYGGTSVLAGLKVFRGAGFFREFRWAFGVEDAVLGVGRNGPGLVGTWWRSGMSWPDSAGRIWWGGDWQGGHAYVVSAVDVSGVRSWLDGEVEVTNSWGPGWGREGRAWLKIRDFGAALEAQGECAFAQRRTWRPAGLP